MVSCSVLPGWLPTSQEALNRTEDVLFKSLDAKFLRDYIDIGNNNQLWTISCADPDKPPLVLVHGFAGGTALWLLNLDTLTQFSSVYAFDVLGFGKSSRPDFPSDPDEVETMFVDSIEQWRINMGLEKFVLLGHSFGAFLTTSYTIRHPERVRHLILVDPWGFIERPPPDQMDVRLPLWVNAVKFIMKPFNPLSIVRAAGPLGPTMVQRFRSDIGHRFSGLVSREDICNYIYHINARKPAGEIAFKTLSLEYRWSKRPLVNRLHQLDPMVPITLIRGAWSWLVGPNLDQILQDRRPSSTVTVHVVKKAGHHVYSDKPATFNFIIKTIMQSQCQMPDDCTDLTRLDWTRLD